VQLNFTSASGFGVGQRDHLLLEIQVLGSQLQGFSHAAACESSDRHREAVRLFAQLDHRIDLVIRQDGGLTFPVHFGHDRFLNGTFLV